MKAKHAAAVDLLMQHPDPVVAEMLGVRLATLRQWMADIEFRNALREREEEQKRSLARLARQAAVNAAASLCASTAEGAKADGKLMLEVLKLSGAFEPEEGGPEDMLSLLFAREGADDE